MGVKTMPKVKKSPKSKNKKHSNVVPIRKDLKTLENEEKILSTEEIEEQERKRTNAFARKICDEIDRFVIESKLSADYAYYHFLFHLKIGFDRHKVFQLGYIDRCCTAINQRYTLTGTFCLERTE